MHEGKAVIDVAGGYQELVLTYFNHLARLQARGTESPEVVARRLAEARRELQAAHLYDYLIVNDSLDDAEREFRRSLRDLIGSS